MAITSVLVLLATISGVGATVLLMFVPAIMELRNPKDAGPRMIAGNFSSLPLTLTKMPSIIGDIEGETSKTKTYVRLPGFLFNLESFPVE
jgi:hypothetical protein